MSKSLNERIKAGMEMYLEGQICKYKMNVEVLLHNQAGVAEHPDLMETIETELGKIADFEDKLEVLKKHFQNGANIVSKYARHDNSNKKRNRHKSYYEMNKGTRIKKVGFTKNNGEENEKCDFSIYGLKSER